eukprot:CAMPEP_0197658186 /NCGR_PEP_ID=MMETSP1338-20131121/45085_1 /TAXON_ID=43686 ORGANISM="Pelagodinium beii, Strain RCC1491" /NCGR_SAMPLE_ID=MMETSP1338 /ASSEMBLY_ACC=CAM_ASM_000754 /LENGTH=1276 /DNA_ID=CAMNT_0043234727 /DNA_START=72 /DNA_END=3902 /DNA_ORIENTATION=-
MVPMQWQRLCCVLGLLSLTAGRKLKNSEQNAADSQALCDLTSHLSRQKIAESVCTVEELKAAGYSCEQLRDAGKTATELKAGGFVAPQLLTCKFDCSELVAAGFSTEALKDAQCSASQLKDAGRALVDLKTAQFTAAELKDAGFSAMELKTAGFDLAHLKAAIYTLHDLMQAKFQPSEFKIAGYSAKELVTAQATSDRWEPGWLVQAGYTASEMKEAGISAKDASKSGVGVPLKELVAANYAASAIKEAGFTAADLKGAGVGLDRLIGAGYDVSELKAAGYGVKDLRKEGISIALLHGGGFLVPQLMDAGVTAKEMKMANVAASELKDHVTCRQLKWAGYTLTEILEVPLPVASCKTAGFEIHEFFDHHKKVSHNSGVSLGFGAEMLGAGYHPAVLRREFSKAFTASAFKHMGVGAGRLAWMFSAKELKDAGYTLYELRAVGVSPEELLSAGFPKNDVETAGLTFTITDFVDVKAAMDHGYSGPQLAGAGIKASQLQDVGFTLKDLTSKDYSFPVSAWKWSELDLATVLSQSNLETLHATGWDLNLFFAAGSTDIMGLKNLGYTVKDFLDVGFKATEIKGVFALWELKKAGCPYEELLNSGFTDMELKGCDPKEVKRPCSVWELLEAGHNHSSIKEAGFSASEMKDAGLSLKELVEANYSVIDVKFLDYPLKELLAHYYDFPAEQFKDAGYNASQLKEAGMTLASLNLAGFPRKDILSAGFDCEALKNSDFAATPEELKNASYEVSEIIAANYSLKKLSESGLTVCELRDAGMSYAQLEPLDTEDHPLSQCLRHELMSKAKLDIKELFYAGIDEVPVLKKLGFHETDIKNLYIAVDTGDSADHFQAAVKLLSAGLPVDRIDEVDVDKAIGQFKLKGSPVNSLIDKVSPLQLKKGNYTALELLMAGVNASKLVDAYSPEEIDKAAKALVMSSVKGFADLGLSVEAAIEVGENVSDTGASYGQRTVIAKSMREADYSAADLRRRGFSAVDMKAAGFSAMDILYGGVGANELSNAGFDEPTIWNAAKAFKLGGATIRDASGRGFDAAALLFAGFQKSAIQSALPNAENDISLAAKSLRSSGITVRAMAALGMTALDMKNAGYTAQEMLDSGYSLSDLRLGDFHAEHLLMAGKSKKELLAVGFSQNDLLTAGKVTEKDAEELKALGYDSSDLKEMGFTVEEPKPVALELGDEENSTIAIANSTIAIANSTAAMAKENSTEKNSTAETELNSAAEPGPVQIKENTGAQLLQVSEPVEELEGLTGVSDPEFLKLAKQAVSEN